MKKLFGIILTVLLFGASVSVGAFEQVIYYHSDVFGSPVAATDSSGAVLWKESYTPYGDRTRNQDQGSNEIWFHAKPVDVESGLSYFGARYYDPMVGRFMGIDPEGFDESNAQSFNKYAYGNNNPYRYRDPNGKSAIDVGFFIYDVGKLAVTLHHGGDVTSALVDVGLSAAGVVIPIPFVGEGLKAARATEHLAAAAASAERAIEATRAIKEIRLSRELHGEAARHAEDAIRAGKPATLTIDRTGTAANRQASIGATEKVPGKHLDEYPPAMFKEGGTNASVRPISPRDNMSAGACIGNACRGLPDGARVRVQITD